MYNDYTNQRIFAVDRDILLYGKRLDEFYELVKDRSVEMHDRSGRGSGIRNIGFADGQPRTALTISERSDMNGFAGVSVYGQLPELIMGAAYGDEASWGAYEKELLPAALQGTDVMVQPRQSNTWGPVSLDHVYEFTGGLSLAVKSVTGKEPDSYMADYRNSHNRHLQDTKEAIAVENRATILNPAFIRERMKGGEGTAEAFGKTFRNIFGWNVTRPASLDEHLYDDLFGLYIADEQHLGLHDYFQNTDPAAYQTMTAVMLESARKGYWKPTEEQLKQTAQLHAELTRESGAACTEFVCDNSQLQNFIASQLDASQKGSYERDMAKVKENTSGQREMILKQQNNDNHLSAEDSSVWQGTTIAIVIIVVLAAIIFIRLRRGKEE